MAHEQQQFFLKWNDFQSNMVSSFKHLRDEKSFTDVTLACEGQTCKAHKMVLSACSPYFKTLLEENPSKHPIIILKDVPFSHLQSILEFMYAGEVNVSQEQLPAFLKTAERLKVKGLAEAPQGIKREWWIEIYRLSGHHKVIENCELKIKCHSFSGNGLIDVCACVCACTFK